MLQEMFWASNLWTQHSQLGFVDAGLTNCTLAQRRFLVRHGSSAPVLGLLNTVNNGKHEW